MSKTASKRFNWSGEWLTSMKLGLILLGIIAVAAGLGTFIPQVDQNPNKAKAVGQIWQIFGFTHIYSTFWFRLLLGLLCLNLLACSLKRSRRIYGRVFQPRLPLDVSGLPNKFRTEINGDFTQLQQSMQRIISKQMFRLTTQETAEGWSFHAVRRRMGYWGSFLTHVAFVILVLGAFSGNLLGFKGYFIAGAGGTLPIQSIMLSSGKVAADFRVRINSAQKKYLSDGELDNWYTDLSILNKNGQEMSRQTLSVNHPFSYQGITFYQANFANGVRLTANIRGQKKAVVLQEQDDYFQAPGTDLYFVVAGIQGEPEKPLINYLVFKGNGAQPVQQGNLLTSQTASIQGQFTMTLERYVPFTGIQVKEDPGVGVVWLGSILLIAGLFLSFYWRPVTVAGILTRNGATDGSLTLGMTSSKKTEELFKEITSIGQIANPPLTLENKSSD